MIQGHSSAPSGTGSSFSSNINSGNIITSSRFGNGNNAEPYDWEQWKRDFQANMDKVFSGSFPFNQ